MSRHQALHAYFITYPFITPCSKDVRLPREMQRAMAAEAEATREAAAKVLLLW